MGGNDSAIYVDATEVDRAMSEARRGATLLKQFDFEKKIEILAHVAQLMRERKDDLVARMVRETAMPIKHASVLFEMSIKKVEYGYGYLQYMRGESFPELTPSRVAFTTTEPYGVVLGVFPFISPLYLAAEVFSAALITGNSVIFHCPAEVLSSFSAMVEIYREARVPAEAIVMLQGMDNSVVLHMAEHAEVDMIVSMAGSYGKKLSAIAGSRFKQIWLSITGKNPTLIFDDADIELAARYVAHGTTFISGLVCTDIELVLVHRSISERFKAALLKEITKLNIGDPWNPKTDIGPIIFDNIVENAEEQLADAVTQGARVLSGGKIQNGYFEPTVVDSVHEDMRLASQRTSAPIAPIVEFEEEEEAVRIANANPYGLRAAVFTNSIDTAFRTARALNVSGVMINHAPFHHHTMYPDGGYKESGLGTLRHLIEELRRKKLVVFHNLPNFSEEQH